MEEKIFTNNFSKQEIMVFFICTFCCCILSLSESLQHAVQPHQTSVIQAEFLSLCSDIVFFIHATSFTDAESNP